MAYATSVSAYILVFHVYFTRNALSFPKIKRLSIFNKSDSYMYITGNRLRDRFLVAIMQIVKYAEEEI